MGDFQRIKWFVIIWSTMVIWVRLLLIGWHSRHAYWSDFVPHWLYFRREKLTLVGWWVGKDGIDHYKHLKLVLMGSRYHGCMLAFPHQHNFEMPLTSCFLFKSCFYQLFSKWKLFHIHNYRFTSEIWVKKNCLILAFRKIHLFWMLFN